ncbi:Gfo/Idh/MocA family protein [Geminicoccus flavidas]|uniref:Gfo/Idh/MocA family protein n=1 Tax=Geminicoccus flavidas TaxID=2506407 RepID=UPI0013587EB4|nr:Gfo/Idh/MocA family oxidoreductase [Geminicoccus flavidas]
MSRRRRGVALLGLGMAVRPHAQSLLDLADRVEVVWAASRSAERCQAFAQAFPFPVTTELGRVLQDERVEAVLVLTPPASHGELGAAVLAAGRTLLIEKPVGLDTGTAVALAEQAARLDRTVGVVLQHRFRPAAQALAAAITSGELGPLCAGQCQVLWWRPQAYYDEPGRGTRARDGGGVLLTQAIHSLDLFRALVGTVDVQASIATTTGLHRMEGEDHVVALARLGEAGAPGAILASTAYYPGFPERIELVFRHATARLEGGRLDLYHQDGRHEQLAGAAASGGGADPMAFSHEAHRTLITDFLDALDEDRAPKVGLSDLIATRRLIDALLRP